MEITSFILLHKEIESRRAKVLSMKNKMSLLEHRKEALLFEYNAKGDIAASGSGDKRSMFQNQNEWISINRMYYILNTYFLYISPNWFIYM